MNIKNKVKMSAEDSAILLRQNKQDMVEALNALGFSEVTMDTPASELADYIRWVGGLRDLNVACIEKATGDRKYFDKDTWQTMSPNVQSRYAAIGVRIRADRQSFVIARSNCSSGSTTSFAWGAQGTNIDGLKDFGENTEGLYDDIDGKSNTEIMLNFAASRGLTLPAAEACRNYKAVSKANGDGYDDDTEWYLPAIGQLMLFYKYRNELNAFITAIFGSSYNISNTWYWSSTEYSATGAWGVNVNAGSVINGNKSYAYTVRACSAAAD